MVGAPAYDPKPSSYDSLVVQFVINITCRTGRSAGLAPLRMLPVASEPVLNDELTEALWLDRPPTTGLNTADGLLEILENAVAIMAAGKKSVVR